jgi:hypothetical protein
MAEPKFKVFEGKFPCHTCREEVTSLRLWVETSDLTWMCSQKHMSKAALIKTKKDYEREERE